MSRRVCLRDLPPSRSRHALQKAAPDPGPGTPDSIPPSYRSKQAAFKRTHMPAFRASLERGGRFLSPSHGHDSWAWVDDAFPSAVAALASAADDVSRRADALETFLVTGARDATVANETKTGTGILARRGTSRGGAARRLRRRARRAVAAVAATRAPPRSSPSPRRTSRAGSPSSRSARRRWSRRRKRRRRRRRRARTTTRPNPKPKAASWATTTAAPPWTSTRPPPRSGPGWTDSSR